MSMKEMSKEENGSVKRKALIKTIFVMLYIAIWFISIIFGIITRFFLFYIIVISPFIIASIYLIIGAFLSIYELFLFREEEKLEEKEQQK